MGAAVSSSARRRRKPDAERRVRLDDGAAAAPRSKHAPWTTVGALGAIVFAVALVDLVAAAIACRPTAGVVRAAAQPRAHAVPAVPAAASAAVTWGGARVAVSALAVFVTMSAIARVVRTPVWRAPETLLTDAVSHGGGLQAHLNLAAAYPDRLDPRILLHLEEARRLAPASDTQTRFTLGVQLVHTRADVERGLALLRTVASQRPTFRSTPSASARRWRSSAGPRRGCRTSSRRSGRRGRCSTTASARRR
jgi:hypothetical protein